MKRETWRSNLRMMNSSLLAQFILLCGSGLIIEYYIFIANKRWHLSPPKVHILLVILFSKYNYVCNDHYKKKTKEHISRFFMMAWWQNVYYIIHIISGFVYIFIVCVLFLSFLLLPDILRYSSWCRVTGFRAEFGDGTVFNTFGTI